MEIYRHLLLYFVNFMVESSKIRFSLYQENENGLSFWDLDLGPMGSTGHIYGYALHKQGLEKSLENIVEFGFQTLLLRKGVWNISTLEFGLWEVG